MVRDLVRLRTEDLAQLQDLRVQRLLWLDNKHRGSKNFTEWLAKNQDRYRTRVYGPVLAEINVRDPTHQRFVESHIGSTSPVLAPHLHLLTAYIRICMPQMA